MRRRDWHAHPQPRTLGDLLDEARPWRVLRDLAALVFIFAAIIALLIVLDPTQGVAQ